ncbi:hypothetical protein [Rhodococcus sp. USK13]|uniref:AMP-binding enzyme n=1 Tax=Rhodococcus sp. USK13 TaxID=2806442 RepID=UPI002016D8A7|nr:hypothetical protein [Rhodococcus sp. USK13]
MAVVIGVPDDHYGDEVMAVVAPTRLRSRQGGRHRMEPERLSAYMIPGIVRFVDQLPKGATGKIVKGDIDCSNPGRCLLDGDVGCLCSYFGQDRISQKAIPNRNPQRRLSPDIRRDVHHFRHRARRIPDDSPGFHRMEVTPRLREKRDELSRPPRANSPTASMQTIITQDLGPAIQQRRLVATTSESHEPRVAPRNVLSLSGDA